MPATCASSAAKRALSAVDEVVTVARPGRFSKRKRRHCASPWACEATVVTSSRRASGCVTRQWWMSTTSSPKMTAELLKAKCQAWPSPAPQASSPWPPRRTRTCRGRRSRTPRRTRRIPQEWDHRCQGAWRRRAWPRRVGAGGAEVGEGGLGRGHGRILLVLRRCLHVVCYHTRFATGEEARDEKGRDRVLRLPVAFLRRTVCIATPEIRAKTA